MSTEAVVILVLAWVGIGLATGWWMVRRGHDRKWTLIAVALGPLFVPIAFERVERLPRLVAQESSGGPAAPARPGGPRVLVGMDGSPESDRALDTALGLFGTGLGLLVLTEVVCYDAADDEECDEVKAASAHLNAAAARATEVPVRVQILAGPPGQTLGRFAKEQDMDLVVAGRRGRGLSPLLMGSVSAHLVNHSTVPVLVVEPSPAHQAESRAPAEPKPVVR